MVFSAAATLYVYNYVVGDFTEDNIKTTAFYRQQHQQQLQMWPRITRWHHCSRRCDIAMVIVIFTGHFSLK